MSRPRFRSRRSRYCWRDETPLSNTDLLMDDDVYVTRQAPAVTLGYRGAGNDGALAQLNGA